MAYGPMFDARSLASRYQAAHNEMRNIDGLQPQEAFDELLKYIFFKERDEKHSDPVEMIEGLASKPQLDTAEAEIRARFTTYLKSQDVPSRWHAEGICLSRLALIRVHGIFQGLKLGGTNLDIRSAALREFLSGPLRKGLGIFLTPEDVVRMVVEAIDPQPTDSILDPACGSGTFLVEAANHIVRNDEAASPILYGVDKNPRMVQLAEFNCAHLGDHEFKRASSDALAPIGSPTLPHWFEGAAFDVVLMNPPFGVNIDEQTVDFSEFSTAQSVGGRGGSKMSSEIVFVERALRLLRPGGRLGVVLPRSVITNRSLAAARAQLGKLGAVLAVVTLPPETFAATGTQTTTVVLIVERFSDRLSPASMISPIIARVENVGFDTTGRQRAGNQLPSLGQAIAKTVQGAEPSGILQRLPSMVASDSFGALEQMLGEDRGGGPVGGRCLRSLIEFAALGATPARSAYSDEGLFLVKVGNLTGSGINWTARDRNFVSTAGQKRYEKSNRILKTGDIVLTSSAHASRYIAKKIDIITCIPAEVGGRAAFVGEVMLVRAMPGVDPYVLLAYLRSPKVVQALQDRVSGQTAHLHPDALLSLPIHEDILESPIISEIATVLRREAQLNDELNEAAFSQAQLWEQLEKSTSVKFAAE